MTVVFAGKSNALIAAIIESLKVIPKSHVKVLPASSDANEDSWHYSIKNFCQKSEILTISLEECYVIEDLVLISIQYDKILHPDKFKSQRLFNIHFSYLPFYKGVYPAIWPILNQEEFSGVTLHYIDAGIDTGHIIDREKIFLDSGITARELYLTCQSVAVKIFKRNFAKILNGQVISTPQPNNVGCYYSKTSLSPGSTPIDLHKTASEVSAQLRAFSFREYQMPVVHGMQISSVAILPERSSLRAGKIVSETNEHLVISTIDYNLLLRKDYGSELFDHCTTGNVEALRKIIDHIEDINITNNRGWTALMIASFNEHLEIVKLLIEKGADVNGTTYKGTTVLMFAKSAAAKSGNLEVLRYLIAQGAEVDTKDNSGKFLLEYAIEEDNQEVADFLISKSKIASKIFSFKPFQTL